jgi:hypothetical protein
VSTGIRLHTDRAMFQAWARAMPGVVLPSELEIFGPGEGQDPGETALPPVVAASLALHGCPELAITVRRWMPEQRSCAWFAIAGDLAASLWLGGDQVEIGLFGLSSVVAEVIRLVPAEPPVVDVAANSVGLQVTVFAGAATWEQTLIGGAPRWRRVWARPEPVPSWWGWVSDIHQELAADLRLALADLIGSDR